MVNINDFPFLYEYQKEGVLALLNGKQLLLDSVGLGKSVQSLVYCEIMNYPKVLIVCPSPLKENFANEIAKFLKKECLILDGNLEERKSIFENYKKSNIRYLICNYEKLLSRNEFLFDFFFHCIILDEIHRIKNYKSKTYKNAIKLKTGYRIGLTATMITNTPIEAYAIVNFLKPYYFKYNEFMNKYAVMGIIYHDFRRDRDVIGPVAWKNLDDLYEKIKPLMIKRKAEDVLPQLPETIYKNYYVTLSSYEQEIHDFYFKKMKECYEKRDDQMFSYLSLMQQVACGCRMIKGSLSENLINIEKDENSKLKVLKEILEDLGDERVLMFTKFERVTRIIAEEIGTDKCYVVTGDTKNKIAAIEEFKNSDKKYLIATDCLGMGVNLEFLHILINYDLGFTPAKMIQRSGRLQRLTQVNKMLVINLIARNTYEDKIVKILEGKQRLINESIEGISYGLSDKEVIRELVG